MLWFFKEIIFIRYFLYLHFKCCPLSSFPLWKPSMPFSLPMLTNPPTPASLAWYSLTLGLWAFPSWVQWPLLSWMTNQAILCYPCSWNHGSLHVHYGPSLAEILPLISREEAIKDWSKNPSASEEDIRTMLVRNRNLQQKNKDVETKVSELTNERRQWAEKEQKFLLIWGKYN